MESNYGKECCNMSVSINEIKNYLVKNNIKPSFPRLKIFEYMASRPTHPTADDIHSALVKEMPTLSKTTVYNTLDLFIRSNIVRSITIDGNEQRFDVDVTNHGHFKCQVCQIIYEFDLDPALINPGSLKNFRIFERNVFFKGICSYCLDKAKADFK
jgi:Fe2+ or Zn2+ uptake regulation protein